MLPYAPVHHLLFSLGAPRLLVMTSANRSSEPIAYEDDDARRRLAGMADAIASPDAQKRNCGPKLDSAPTSPKSLRPEVAMPCRGRSANNFGTLMLPVVLAAVLVLGS